MKKIFIGAMLLASMSAFAQETYENANLATENLNGTARYVGMGGAMEALGADISTIGTNPAGIGMFRRSQASVSAGFVSQKNGSFARPTGSNYFLPSVDGTHVSFDQIGAVVSTNMGGNRFLNFGFNYHKSRNFNGLLNVGSTLDGASQNKLTYDKAYEGLFDDDDRYSINDYLNENGVLKETTPVNGENKVMYYYTDANSYQMKKAQTGYISEYDFNISGNASDRVYLGLTVGIKDVHYDAYTLYNENCIDNLGSITVEDHRWIRGSGFDVKAGAIFFPIEDSAFRIGVNVATPTWYSLTTYSQSRLHNDTDLGDAAYSSVGMSEDYDYRFNTPWKFGVSLGHTVGKQLALGASYEYADYRYIQTRVIDGRDAWGNTRSYKDDVMNQNTKDCLKGVHTIKLGAEFKPMSDFAIRIGYNYISPMYKMSGYRDGSLNSPGTYYSSTTDYTNWKETQRITFGLGYTFGQFAIDFAYQYQTQKGEFCPFMSYTNTTNHELDNVADVVSVKNDRHQLLATLSYKF